MTHEETIDKAKCTLDDLQRACEDALDLLEASDSQNKDEITARAENVLALLQRTKESLGQIGTE